MIKFEEHEGKLFRMDGVYTGRMTSCFVPEPSLQAIEPDFPEPDYDKTFESEKNFLIMGSFS